KARYLADVLAGAGAEVVTTTYFDTLTVRVPGRAADVVAAALERGVNLWRVDDDHVLLSTDETVTLGELYAVCEAFGARGGSLGEPEDPHWPEGLLRRDEVLTHPVFHRHHSETAMLRYLRSLADKDYALDRGMIPLGSCTMKLNATTEMEPITWPEFTNLHPFAPADQSEGSRELIRQLSSWLCEITGYDEISLQPNAGSQ